MKKCTFNVERLLSEDKHIELVYATEEIQRDDIIGLAKISRLGKKIVKSIYMAMCFIISERDLIVYWVEHITV